MPYDGDAQAKPSTGDRPYRPPSVPYGAVDGGVPAQVGPPPDQQLPPRCSGSATGDLEIRPRLRRILIGALLLPLMVVYLWAKGGTADATVGLGFLAVAAWIIWSLATLLARLRVAGGVLEVRTLGRRRVVVPLTELDRPVRSYYAKAFRLHLRQRGGRHVVTLSGNLWGHACLEVLGRRLDAVSAPIPLPGFVGTRALERQFPGSLSALDKHPALVRLVSVSAAVIAMRQLLAMLGGL